MKHRMRTQSAAQVTRALVVFVLVTVIVGLLQFAQPLTVDRVAEAARPVPTATPTSGAGTFTNPVISTDFPDPDSLQVGTTYYAYATGANNGGGKLQAAKSTDLVHWQMLGDPLASVPSWASSQRTLFWAPEVTTSGSTYLMYFTARDLASDRQCIGVATSSVPQGPFNPVGTSPLICQAQEGGSIDPASFVDTDGSRYLLWKNDGNCCGLATWIYIQQVSADGLTLQGTPTRLIRNDQSWEGRLIEAPTLWKRNGKYYLFYSANSYSSSRYAVGYAVSSSLLGPYTKPSKPILTTDQKTGGAYGPGGQDIALDKDGETWMLYHSWDTSLTFRWMQIDEVIWQGDTPVVAGPDRVPQPLP